MRHIYYEKPEIPCSANSYIHKHKGKKDVFVFLPVPGELLTNSTPRVVIGVATSDTMMHPNNNFKEMYPLLWKKYYGESENLKMYQLNAGMYELCLGIGYSTGLYTLLQSVLGLFMAIHLWIWQCFQT